MKVLQINAVYGISSTGRTTMELDRALKVKGHSSIVAVTVTNKQQDNIYIVGNKLDWKVHSLLSRLFGTQGYFSYFSTKRLLEYIGKEKPDIIHLRNLHANYINLPMLLKYIAKNKIPTVVTLHDCWVFTGKCCHYHDADCDRWQKECGNCPSLKKWNKSWFFDRSRKMLKDKKILFGKIPKLAVVGVSDWTKTEAQRSILKNAWEITRIYNWIDTDIFYPREADALRKELKLESKFVVLGIAQSWNIFKGLNVFIELAKSLPNIQFVMIGKMPSNIDLPENIETVGVLNSTDDLANYYSMADVLLNPSIQETFGKTTAESISCGTPVIGYNVTATPELIGDSCGIIVNEVGNLNEIQIAIEAVQKNGKELYREKCVNFAKSNFLKEDLINQYINLYEEMVRK